MVALVLCEVSVAHPEVALGLLEKVDVAITTTATTTTGQSRSHGRWFAGGGGGGVVWLSAGRPQLAQSDGKTNEGAYVCWD